jgi:hypothetical protein
VRLTFRHLRKASIRPWIGVMITNFVDFTPGNVAVVVIPKSEDSILESIPRLWVTSQQIIHLVFRIFFPSLKTL